MYLSSIPMNRREAEAVRQSTFHLRELRDMELLDIDGAPILLFCGNTRLYQLQKIPLSVATAGEKQFCTGALIYKICILHLPNLLSVFVIQKLISGTSFT